MSHKHCIYCGVSSDAGGLVGAICLSKNNPLPLNTVGDRPHAYPVDGWETKADERARAEQKRSEK